MTGTVRSIDRRIFALAIPALGALAIDPLLTLIDTAFVARLGVVPLAALGVDAAILGVAFFAFNFLAYATTPLVARLVGRGDRKGATRVVGDAMILAIGIGVIAAGAMVLLAPLLVDLMGASTEAGAEAVGYLRIRALATPFVLVVMAGHGAFRGYQNTRTPLLVAAGVSAINLVLDPLLIFAAGWGLVGAAVATVIAQVVGAAWFLRILRATGMVSWPSGLRESIPTLLELSRAGALITVRTGFILIAFTVAASVAARIGDAQIAAHQVVYQVWLLSVMLIDAFGIAGQAMVGETSGLRDRSTTNLVARRLMIWGFAGGVLLAFLFLFASPLMGVLVEDETAAELATSAGRVAGAWMPIAAPVFIADSVYLGMLALGSLVLSTASGTVLFMGLLYLTPLSDSLSGIWWAVGVMMIARALVLAFAYPRAVAARS